MSIKSIAVTVGTSATSIFRGLNGTGDAPQGVSILNNGAVTLYIGGPDVTAVNGTPIPVGESKSVDLISGEEVFGIAASPTNTRVLLTRV